MLVTSYLKSTCLNLNVYSITTVCITKKVNNHIIRGMKRSAIYHVFSSEKQRNFIAQLQNTINILYTTPITNKTNLLDKTVSICLEPGEHIVNQSLLKGAHSRISYTKKDIIQSLSNNNKPISSKIIVENLNEKSDVRFIHEVLITNGYSETSDTIKEIQLNSEMPTNTANILSKIQTGNKHADTKIMYQINNQQTSMFRDIKTGTNMNNITKGVLGEIPYMEDGKVYTILNEPLTLKRINEQRLIILKDYKFKEITENEMQLKSHIATINSLEFLLQQSEIIHNNAVQEQLYAIMALEKKLNFSVYYAIIVKEARYNPDFFTKLSPYITSDIFNNKKTFNIFMAKAVIIYHNTVMPIIGNIEKTKGTEWEASFIDQITDDIFSHS